MKIIVISCDKYLWLIPTFLHFYKKKWPDNPYQTDFISEVEAIEGQTTFCPGKLPWATRLIKYLDSDNERKFLIFCEDYILKKKVNSHDIKRAEDLCVDDIGCVRLNAHDRESHFLIDSMIKGFKQYPLDKPYSVSLQTSIWQKEFLLEFLREGENIWQTEIDGSKRICESRKKVIWSDVPILIYHACGYMQKGKIVKPVARWVEENW